MDAKKLKKLKGINVEIEKYRIITKRSKLSASLRRLALEAAEELQDEVAQQEAVKMFQALINAMPLVIRIKMAKDILFGCFGKTKLHGAKK